MEDFKLNNDADLMSMMDDPEFWTNYESDPEFKDSINAFIFQDEAPEQAGIKDFSQMGMSGLKDMQGYAKATPLQGLMSMAQYNNKPKRGLMG